MTSIQLKIGEPDYEWKPVGELHKAEVRGRKPGRNIPLILLPWPEMEKMRQALPFVRGMPRYASYGSFQAPKGTDQKPARMWLHPTPDGEYWLELTDDVKPEPKRTLTLPKRGEL